MRPPKRYTDNLKNGIVTLDMLDACLLSVNERETNYIYSSGHWLYNTRENNIEKYYGRKKELLSYITPKCIHKEIIRKRLRISSKDFKSYDV